MFEAYTDPTELDYSDFGSELMLSKEEMVGSNEIFLLIYTIGPNPIF